HASPENGSRKRGQSATHQLPRARLFSAGTNLCQSSRGNVLRNSHFRRGTINQASKLPAITGAATGRMAEAIGDRAARVERIGKIQLPDWVALIEVKIQWRCRGH